MIVDKFEEQVKKYPNHIAVKVAKDELTYQELNECANAVAHEIIDNRDDVISLRDRETVALLFEHGIDMIIGKFGALKAAKIYVPMDPSYPPKLLKYMLENSEAGLIITNDKTIELAEMLIQESNREVEIINITKIKITSFLENINPKCDGNEIAYIIYTSGSTGRPKGVFQSHRNTLHFAECYRKTIDITLKDRMTLMSSFSHDAGIGDIYAALLNGVSLYPWDVKSSLSMNEIVNWLKNERISIWYSVPTLYRHVMNIINESDDFPSLRFIILGGESVLPNDINIYQKTFPSAKFAIMYGQSESSINSMQIYSADSEIEEIALGEPMPETEILIVDDNKEEVSPLEIGEIVILSNYVALGYWKEEEKSKSVFGKSGAVRTYWTGDLGKLLLDGSIKFFGRKDFQVNIRGYRIELGGIENQLLEHHSVKEAVVIGSEDMSGDKYLCAYIVTDEDITSNELRGHLSNNLPEYMIPSFFVNLEKLPLAPSGKVDRKALPEPSGVRAEYVAPRSKTEEVLVQIWSEVLRSERVGINDDFFELGGHSLKAATVINKINMELDVNLPLLELYANPSISGFAEYISGIKDEFENIDGLSLLKNGKPGSKNFFIIHAGQGRSEVYIKLARNMNDEFNYWGLNYDDSAYYDPYIIPIEKLATKYIKKIKKIQKKEPYYISGWCIGGIIAFEMVKQLESAGDKVDFFGMYNTRATSKKYFMEKKFKIKAEHNLLYKLFPEYNFSVKYKDIISFVDLWNQVVDDLESLRINDESIRVKVYNQICSEEPFIKRVVTDYDVLQISELIQSYNSLRLLTNVFWRYEPKGKIDVQVNYFVATREEHECRMLWNRYCKKEVTFHRIDVDHISMFMDDEDVKKLAYILTSVLDKYNQEQPLTAS